MRPGLLLRPAPPNGLLVWGFGRAPGPSAGSSFPVQDRAAWASRAGPRRIFGAVPRPAAPGRRGARAFVRRRASRPGAGGGFAARRRAASRPRPPWPAPLPLGPRPPPFRGPSSGRAGPGAPRALLSARPRSLHAPGPLRRRGCPRRRQRVRRLRVGHPQ